MRDAVTAKKFFLMMERGQLPDAVTDAWEDMNKQRGNNMRVGKTKIINRFYKRTALGTMVAQPDHPLLKRSRTHSTKGVNGDFHDGMIFEEARTKCGGFDELKIGVRANRVKTTGSGDWPDLTYHFRRTRVGAEESFERKDDVTAVKATTHEGFKALEIAMDNFIPNLMGGQFQPLAMATNLSRGQEITAGSSMGGGNLLSIKDTIGKVL